MATHKQWNYYSKHEGEINSCSRKTKKAIKKEFDEMRLEWEQSEPGRLYNLPECERCEGTGIFDDDSGIFECWNCEGTGKTGWHCDEHGNKQPNTAPKGQGEE
ncbi:hypothetical protein MMB75_25350 [Paenibacillus sp. P2(2022)]|uniref:hypothetical protein n=1 Tax=Paenibacillus sp. P2(2022) TaxID=2917813 RepID=UPI002406E3FB|nr:hypothetical protein [Paenibacillus sp. P2(2022)]MDG0056955.1 hypothetical protein [Paenibacillus sp. P2(2022)]